MSHVIEVPVEYLLVIKRVSLSLKMVQGLLMFHAEQAARMAR